MQIYAIALTPRAFDDLEQIREFLVSRSPAGADNVRQAINATLSHLSERPQLGRNRPDLAVRAIGVPRYHYSIYYRIGVRTIEIIHVRDDRRRPLAPGDL